MSRFTDDIARFRAKVASRVDQVIKKVGFDLHSLIVERTPHDTGRAKAGWALDARPEMTIIYNNVEYIVPLEYGHSKQAPQGMVRVSIADIVNAWPNLVTEVRRTVK